MKSADFTKPLHLFFMYAFYIVNMSGKTMIFPQIEQFFEYSFL